MKRFSKWFVLFALSLYCLTACDNQDVTIKVDPQNTSTQSDLQPETRGEQNLRLGIGSIITPKEGYSFYRRLVDYLEKQLAMKITVVDRGNYQEFNNLLAAGKLDVAFVCGGPYVEGKDDFHLELLVVPETLEGEKVYYANLIVPYDSPAQKLEDLRGKRFAFTDPQSNSGKLVPTFMLAKAGETPESFFGDVVYTYAHDKSIYAVADNTVDGASVDSLIYEYLIDKSPELLAKVRVLSKSEPYGIPPVVVRPGIPAALREQLRTVLMEMDQNPEGRDILQGMKIQRFTDSDDAAYDTIRQIRAFIQKQSQ